MPNRLGIQLQAVLALPEFYMVKTLEVKTFI